MTELVAGLVSALHLAFVVFMTWAPFSGNRMALVMHLVVTPLLWLHWALNDDSCALTLLETKLRGVDSSESFMHSLVSPVYKVRDADMRTVCWLASAGLWAVTASQVGWTDLLDVVGFGGGGSSSGSVSPRD